MFILNKFTMKYNSICFQTIFLFIAIVLNIITFYTIANAYSNVKVTSPSDDLGYWLFPFQINSNIANLWVLIIIILTIIILAIKSKKVLISYFNLLMLTFLIYSISISVTRLPNTDMDRKECQGNLKNLTSMANCGEKIPSMHTMIFIISALFLISQYPNCKIITIILIGLGIFTVLIGHLHRSVDIFLGIVIAYLLYHLQLVQKDQVYSKNWVILFMVLLITILLLLLFKYKIQNK